MNEELLTLFEVARALRVDVTTVRRWIKLGIFEGVRLPQRGTRTTYRARKRALDRLLNTPVRQKNDANLSAVP